MSLEAEDVSLSNLLGGGVVERFDDELKAVLRNILDPNTTLSAREITLKVKIKPDKDRDLGQIDIEVKPKMAPAAPLATKVWIGVDKTGPCATEYNPHQPSLAGIDTSRPAPTPLRAIGGNA